MKLSNILNRFGLTITYKKILKNVYWAVLGKVVGIMSSFFVGVFVARYLGPEQYGMMNYVISYVTLFSILATFGLDSIEVRELSKNNADKNTILGTAFIIRISFAIFTIVLILVSLFTFETDRFTFWMVMVYSLSLILSSLNVIRNYFTSIVLNEFVVKTEIFRTLIGAGIKIFLLIYHYSLAWFIAASVFDFLLIASGYLYSYRKKVDSIWEWQFKPDVARMLIKESFPLLLSGTAIIIYMKIDQVMIRNMIDNAALGQFSVASKINEMTIFIPTIIAQTVTPLLVQAHQKNIEEYKQKRQKFIDIMVWSSFFIALAISLGANLIITLLFGNMYDGAIPVLRIMAWQAVFVALFASSGQLIIIENLQKIAVLRNIVGCVVSVILNLLLIPKYGIIGSAIATIATMAFSGYLSHLLIPQYRYLFKLQTKAIFVGWRIIFHVNKLKG